MEQLIKFTAIGTMALVILLLSSQLTQAQHGGKQGPPPLPDGKQIEQMVEDLSKTLSLSDDQEKKVSEKYFAHFAAVEKKMKARRPNREDKEAMVIDFEKEVTSVLTDDQKEFYDSYLEMQKQNKPHR